MLQVSCLVLGRPKASAFVVGCAADAPMPTLVRRIAAVLGLPEGRLFPLASDAAPLLLFRAAAAGTSPPLRLSDPFLDELNPALRKALEASANAKPAAGLWGDAAKRGVEGSASALAGAVTTYLADRAFFIGDSFMQASVGEFLSAYRNATDAPTASTVDTDRLDLIVCLNTSADGTPAGRASVDGPMLPAVAPPAYAPPTTTIYSTSSYASEPGSQYAPSHPQPALTTASRSAFQPPTAAVFGHASHQGSSSAFGLGGSQHSERAAFLHGAPAKELEDDSPAHRCPRVPIYVWILAGIAAVAVVVAAVVAGVLVSRNNNNNGGGSSTSGSACLAYTVDNFTTAATNSLGYVTGSSSMLSIAWLATSKQLSFVPNATGAYFFENVRNVVWNSAGTPITCAAALTNASYFLFTINGTGSFRFDVQSTCLKTPTVGPMVTVSASPSTYAINVAALTSNASAVADVSAVVLEDILSDGTSTWTLSNLTAVNDLAACGISKYTIVS
ncbi:hypothetical protein HK405_004131 [Cladochytrium tenue]|nr:hypothetical protein HK405_004131 [Cladochytrium tenue]